MYDRNFFKSMDIEMQWVIACCCGSIKEYIGYTINFMIIMVMCLWRSLKYIAWQPVRLYRYLIDIYEYEVKFQKEEHKRFVRLKKTGKI